MDFSQLLIERAFALYEQGDFVTALRISTDINSSRPQWIGAWALTVRCYLELENFTAAQRVVDSGIFSAEQVLKDDLQQEIENAQLGILPPELSHSQITDPLTRDAELSPVVVEIAVDEKLESNDSDTSVNLFMTGSLHEKDSAPHSSTERHSADSLEVLRDRVAIEMTKSTLHASEGVPIRVSAIVSTYNSEKFIESCLEDLTSQTLYERGELEIIIIDSCSPQNERAIAEKYLEMYENITYVRTSERESIYQAWNRGIKLAVGQYITNSNTDDRHRRDALEIMANELDVNPYVALVYGDFIYTTFPCRSFGEQITCGYQRNPDFSPEVMLTGCYVGPQPVWRKSIHDVIGYFSDEYKSAGDYDMWVRIAQHFPMKRVPQLLGVYYENPTGFVNSDLKLSQQETANIWHKYAPHFPPLNTFTKPNFAFFYSHPVPKNGFVNICLVTRNDVRETQRTIHALWTNTRYPHTITVVDIASTDGTKEYLTQMLDQGIVNHAIFNSSSISKSQAINMALEQEPEALYSVVIASDTIIQKPDWLEEMVAISESSPDVGIVAVDFAQRTFQNFAKSAGAPLWFVDNETSPEAACILIPNSVRQECGTLPRATTDSLSQSLAEYSAKVIYSGKNIMWYNNGVVGLRLNSYDYSPAQQLFDELLEPLFLTYRNGETERESEEDGTAIAQKMNEKSNESGSSIILVETTADSTATAPTEGTVMEQTISLRSILGEPTTESPLQALQRRQSTPAELAVERETQAEAFVFKPATPLIEDQPVIASTNALPTPELETKPPSITTSGDTPRTSTPQLNVVWEGSQFTVHSLALVNREQCSNLIDSGSVELTIIPYEPDTFSPAGDAKFEKLHARDIRVKAETDANIAKLPYAWIRHTWPPKSSAPIGAKWIINQPWEFSVLPKDFVETFCQADEIWTPSNFSRNAFVKSGVPADKVQVIPNGINPQLFTPHGNKAELPTSKSFKFLYVGGTIARKGIDILLSSYTKTFTDKDDVTLIIKDIGNQSFYKGQTLGDAIAELKKTPGCPEILYTDGTVSEEQMAELYRACDVYVSSYRGEGFSIPTLEAMACGLPVIVTEGGATDDFVDESVGYLIPSELRNIGRQLGEREFIEDAYLLEPSASALGEILSQCIRDPQENVRKGLLGSLRARTQWTWKKSTLKVLTRLDALYGTTMAVQAQGNLVDNEDGIVWVGKAEQAYMRGDVDEAIALFERAARMGALTKRYTLFTIHRLAMISIAQEETDIAKEFLNRAKQLDNNHLDTVYLESLCHSMKSEWTEAQELLSVALDGWKDKKFESAIGISLDTLLNDTARALYYDGAIDEAQQVYQKALELNPQNADACYGSGLCLIQKGDPEGATEMFAWTVKLNAGYEELVNTILEEAPEEESY